MQMRYRLKLVNSLVMLGGFIAFWGDCVFAQIVPDITLESENSRVTGISPTIDQINGGATRGTNLFHSFQEFNVGEGRSAYFTNPAGIENILTRVTGTNPSNILGTLGVTGGNANLFLINPNGILFGQNASLDVGGSFTATTANAIKLGDTGLFSASEPATSNLLTIRPSALFLNATAPGAIVNQSQAQSLGGQTNSLGGSVGLQVPAGKTLALVGGNVAIEGGNLTAAGGRIELGSLAGVGEVSLSQVGNRWLFGYDNINAFGNIRLEGGALVDASGEGGGDVQIQGAQLEMTQGSVIYANTLGLGDGGEILVRTTETVALRDESEITADVLGSGTGGDLTIATGRLLVRDGARVSASASGTREGGTLSVTVSDTVELIGISADGRFSSGLFAQASGEGDAGDLTIATRRLLLRDGAQVNVSSLGAGIAGNLRIEAGYTSLDNEGKLQAQSAFGNGGNIQLATEFLLLRRNSLISAVSGNPGSNGIGGNIYIDMDFLVTVPKENSDIVATGYGRPVGSNIQVNAQGIFGTQFREQLTSRSDIVATGTVELNTPDVDPNRGLTNLPTEVVDASNQIAQACGTRRAEVGKNEFIVTGRGGIPSNPYEPLSFDVIWDDIHPPAGLSSSRNSKPNAARIVTPQSVISNAKPPIVEAQGWIINDKGQVVLTAATSTPVDSWLQSATCPSS
jgi:filamentous hemagglutinin family protein